MRGMLITLGIVLVMLWVLGFLVFKTAGFLIHLLLIVGAIALISGFVRRTAGPPVV
jgi:hypothetical protein